MIIVTAFAWVPPFAQGVVRDLRVRWALEEAGLSYSARLLRQGDQASDAYQSIQPFAQVPAYEEDGFVLFESGAIVLHIAERSDALMPAAPHGRDRVRVWLFAALNSVEPALQQLAEIDIFAAGKEWARLRRPEVVDAIGRRLDQLAVALGDADWLVDDRFTAADLMMATVLRILRHTDIVGERPVLATYLARCEARPAFRRALADQMAPFADGPPA